jgi:hypothetical protein
MGPLMAVSTANRPISLVRCPQGRAKKCFFQKHDAGSFGEHVHQVPILEKNGSTEDYLYVQDVAGILTCVQMGTIEFHGWGSKVEEIEKPDRLVFDLDPDEGLGFEEVKRAARDLKRYLADMGLQTFPLMTVPAPAKARPFPRQLAGTSWTRHQAAPASASATPSCSSNAPPRGRSRAGARPARCCRTFDAFRSPAKAGAQAAVKLGPGLRRGTDQPANKPSYSGCRSI